MVNQKYTHILVVIEFIIVYWSADYIHASDLQSSLAYGLYVKYSMVDLWSRFI